MFLNSSMLKATCVATLALGLTSSTSADELPNRGELTPPAGDLPNSGLGLPGKPFVPPTPNRKPPTATRTNGQITYTYFVVKCKNRAGKTGIYEYYCCANVAEEMKSKFAKSYPHFTFWVESKTMSWHAKSQQQLTCVDGIAVKVANGSAPVPGSCDEAAQKPKLGTR